jgi:hypothetical protein
MPSSNQSQKSNDNNNVGVEMLDKVSMIMMQLAQTTNALNERLSKPIQSHVVLQQLYDTQELDTTIKTEAGAIR